MTKRNTRRGFTLIELLVVVLIIGILAAVAVPQYKKAVEKSQLTEALLIGKHIRQLEEAYYLTTGDYTKNFENLDLDIPHGYKLNNQYTLGKGNNSFQLTPSQIVYYFKPNTRDDLALLFYYANKTNKVNSGKIGCHPYTTYGQELCASLKL